jgi:hypothetical protein
MLVAPQYDASHALRKHHPAERGLPCARPRACRQIALG